MVRGEEQGDSWGEEVKDFQKFRNALSNVDRVALYKGRVMVPARFRGGVLESLHQAHQGTTSMGLRAGESVWSPGLARDLGKVREQCLQCRQNALSQPAAPPKPLPSPDFPFQMVSSDYFHYAGKQYLLLMDRYSGWPVVALSRRETAGKLKKLLQIFFGVYGMPEELTMDRAPVYMAGRPRSSCGPGGSATGSQAPTSHTRTSGQRRG